MIKVSIIGSVGIPARYGGWETLVEYLTKCSSGNVRYVVYCSAKRYDTKSSVYNGARLKYVNLAPNGISSIFYDIFSMWDARNVSDIQLVLGVSGCIFLPIIKIFSKSKFIVNIDGLEWRRDKWGFFAKNFLN